MVKDLSRLLKPRSIAVFGGAWAENVIKQSLKMGFAGQIWPIHPKHSHVAGLPAFKSVNDLPETPDASFIGVNRHLTIDIVQELSKMGAGGAVCFAAGFREAGDTNLQDRLLEAAKDMPIIGPNCYGLISYLEGALLWPDQHGGKRCDAGVAIITQSSNIAINMTMAKRGLPLAFIGTVGNQAQVGFSDLGMALLDDDRISALGLHIEGFGDLRAFEALAAKARTLGKSIVALKVGRSEQARQATVSHTASLAGDDAGAQALLDRLGIARVDSIAVFLESLKLLHLAGPFPSGEIISVSCSGGEASIMADAALKHPSLSYPRFTDQIAKDLRSTLGPMVTIANPFDYHTFIWNDEAAMTQTFTHVMRSKVAIVCFVVDFPRADRCEDREWETLVSAISKAREATGQTVAIIASLPENISETWIETCSRIGIIPLCGLEEGLAAIAAVKQQDAKCIATEPLLLPQQPSQVALIDEDRAKAMLADAGLPIPAKKRVLDKSEAGIAADEIGYPVVVKALGLAHKTEMNAVKLNLQNREKVEQAALAMPSDSLLIEQFVDEVKLELLVGVVLDPAHGYVLTVGAGGVLTEILSDSQSCLLPVSDQDIEKALLSLKVAPILTGYRGQPALALTKLVSAIQCLCQFVEAKQGQISEVEINPLLVRAQDCFAADALMRLTDRP